MSTSTCPDCKQDVRFDHDCKPYAGQTVAVSVPGASNPKTLMGKLKMPMLSVVSSASLIHEAHAMQYGAYLAPKKDGTFGYGPYNWRDQPIEAMVYVDAAMRHLMQWVEGEEVASDSLVHHLGHAKATLGILLDAIENNTVIDDRPKVRSMVATAMFERLKRKL
jgi:hypothetical protein